MQITKSVFSFLLITSACGSTLGRALPEDREVRSAKRRIAGGVAELHVISFDTRKLKARVLIGATIEPVVMDRRMVPWSDLELKKIRACDTKARLKHWRWDAAIGPPEPEDIITVPQGYWWGADVLFLLFDKSKTPEPDCFEAELVVLDNDRRIAATLPIHVERTDRPSPTPPDRGTETPQPPTSDAGAP